MNLVTASWFHFISSGFAGAIVGLSILTIFSDAFRQLLGRVPLTLAQKRFMVGLALSLALLSGLAVHTLMDTITTAWTEPQGPPLHIILKSDPLWVDPNNSSLTTPSGPPLHIILRDDPRWIDPNSLPDSLPTP